MNRKHEQLQNERQALGVGTQIGQKKLPTYDIFTLHIMYYYQITQSYDQCSVFTSLRIQPKQTYHFLTNLPIFKRAPDLLNPLKKCLEFKHIKCSAIRLHLLSFEMWSGHKPSKITYLSQQTFRIESGPLDKLCFKPHVNDSK